MSSPPLRFDAVLGKISNALDENARRVIKQFLSRSTPSKSGGSGPLTARELVSVFDNMDVEVSREEIQFVMDEMGVDTISFEQLLQVADVLSEVDATIQEPMSKEPEQAHNIDEFMSTPIPNPINADSHSEEEMDEGTEGTSESSTHAHDDTHAPDLDMQKREDEEQQKRLQEDIRAIEYPWNYNDVGGEALGSNQEDHHFAEPINSSGDLRHESGPVSPIDPVVYAGGGDEHSPVWSHVARNDARENYRTTREDVAQNENMLRQLLHNVDSHVASSEPAQQQRQLHKAAVVLQRAWRNSRRPKHPVGEKASKERGQSSLNTSMSGPLSSAFFARFAADKDAIATKIQRWWRRNAATKIFRLLRRSAQRQPTSTPLQPTFNRGANRTAQDVSPRTANQVFGKYGTPDQESLDRPTANSGEHSAAGYTVTANSSAPTSFVSRGSTATTVPYGHTNSMSTAATNQTPEEASRQSTQTRISTNNNGFEIAIDASPTQSGAAHTFEEVNAIGDDASTVAASRQYLIQGNGSDGSVDGDAETVESPRGRWRQHASRVLDSVADDASTSGGGDHDYEDGIDEESGYTVDDRKKPQFSQWASPDVLGLKNALERAGLENSELRVALEKEKRAYEGLRSEMQDVVVRQQNAAKKAIARQKATTQLTLKNADEVIEQYHKKAMEAATETERLSLRVESLTQALEAQRSACDELRKELKAQEEQTLNAKSDHRMLELRLTTATEQVEQKMDENVSMEKRIEELEAKILESKEENGTLAQELEDAQYHNKVSTRTIDHLNEETTQQKNEILDLREEAGQLLASRDILASENAKLDAQLQALQSFAQEQSATIQKFGTEKVQMAAELASLHKDYQEKKAACDDSAVVQHNLAQDAQALARDKEAAQKLADKRKIQLDQARRELDELRKYKETAEGHLTAQGVALEDVRQKQKKLVGKVTQAGAQSKASFKPLRETLAKLRADVLEQNESFRNQIGVLNGQFREPLWRLLDKHRRQKRLTEAMKRRVLYELNMRKSAVRQVAELRGPVQLSCWVATSSAASHHGSSAFGDDGTELGDAARRSPVEMLVPQVVDKSVAALAKDGSTVRYRFDRVFGPTADTRDVLADLPSTVRMAMGGYNALIVMLFVMDRDGISSAAQSTFDTMFDEVLSMKSNVVEHVRQSSSTAAHEATLATTSSTQLLKFKMTASFIAIQENAVYDLTSSAHDFEGDMSGKDNSGPLGATAHGNVVDSKAICRRHFESGMERYMNLVKSRGWPMYSSDLLFAIKVEVSDTVTKKSSVGHVYIAQPACVRNARNDRLLGSGPANLVAARSMRALRVFLHCLRGTHADRNSHSHHRIEIEEAVAQSKLLSVLHKANAFPLAADTFNSTGSRNGRAPNELLVFGCIKLDAASLERSSIEYVLRLGEVIGDAEQSRDGGQLSRSQSLLSASKVPERQRYRHSHTTVAPEEGRHRDRAPVQKWTDETPLTKYLGIQDVDDTYSSGAPAKDPHSRATPTTGHRQRSNRAPHDVDENPGDKRSIIINSSPQNHYHHHHYNNSKPVSGHKPTSVRGSDAMTPSTKRRTRAEAALAAMEQKERRRASYSQVQHARPTRSSQGANMRPPSTRGTSAFDPPPSHRSSQMSRSQRDPVQQHYSQSHRHRSVDSSQRAGTRHNGYGKPPSSNHQRSRSTLNRHSSTPLQQYTENTPASRHHRGSTGSRPPSSKKKSFNDWLQHQSFQ